MDPHTMKNFKSVVYPELFERTKAQAPGTKIETTMEQRLRAKTVELMAAPAPNPLPEDIVAEFDRRQEGWISG